MTRERNVIHNGRFGFEKKLLLLQLKKQEIFMEELKKLSKF